MPHRLEVVQRIAHVHEVARLGKAPDDRVRVAGLHLLIGSVGVGPVLPPVEHRELLDAGEPGKRRLVGVRCAAHVGVAAEVDLAGAEEARRATAVAARRVPVARDAHERVEGTRVLDGIASVLYGEHVADAAVAVAGRRIETRGISLGCKLDLVGRNAGDLLGDLGREFGAARLEVLPHGLDLEGAPVFKRYLELALDSGIDGCFEAILGAEAELFGHEALGYAGEQVFLRGGTRVHQAAFHLPVLALPHLGLGVEVRQAIVQLVPYHHAERAAVLFQIGFAHEARHGLEVPGLELRAHRAGSRAHLLAHEERGVGPAFHERLVDEVVLDDDMHPRQRQRAVGLRVQRLPDVGLAAEVGQARIDRDEVVCFLRRVDGHAARVVVVRHLGGTAPTHHDARLVDRRLPAERIGTLHERGEVARALANLIRRHAVRRLEQRRERAVRAHAPTAGRTRHDHDGFAAVLVDDFLVLLGHGLVGLVPRDAHPARIARILGVRAFHRVQDAVGMVGRLDGRLRLRAAVAARREGGRVALDLRGASVFDGHPHAAFHLAATAAARADALDVGLGTGALIGYRQRCRHYARRCSGDSRRCCRQLQERPSRQ